MNIDNLYPVLFECCRITKGINKSIICDLQRNEYYNIPSDIVDLLEACNTNSVYSIKEKYDFRFNDIIEENLRFLEEKEIIFFCDYPEWFPQLSLSWDNPSHYTNALLDYSNVLSENLEKIIDELEKCGCQHVQIRFFENVLPEELENFLKKFHNKNILSLELIVKYVDDFHLAFFKKLFDIHPRIFSILVHSCPKSEQFNKMSFENGPLYFSDKSLNDETCCGNISENYFSTNSDFFIESQNYNNCLNRKISIDRNGFIKNCPSMKKSFGHILDVELNQLIFDVNFTKIWSINKDQISICKDCEFRYICSDCRAYVENPQDIYSKPLKCGYNPYTNEWNEWSKNPLKKKTINFYGIEGLLSNDY